MPVSRKHRPYKLNSNRVPNLDRKLAEKSNREVAREEQLRLESLARIRRRSVGAQSTRVHRNQILELYLYAIQALRDALCSGGKDRTRVASMPFKVKQIQDRKEQRNPTIGRMYEIAKVSDEELEKELARPKPTGGCSQHEGCWKRLREKAK